MRPAVLYLLIILDLSELQGKKNRTETKHRLILFTKFSTKSVTLSSETARPIRIQNTLRATVLKHNLILILKQTNRMHQNIRLTIECTVSRSYSIRCFSAAHTGHVCKDITSSWVLHLRENKQCFGYPQLISTQKLPVGETLRSQPRGIEIINSSKVTELHPKPQLLNSSILQQPPCKIHKLQFPIPLELKSLRLHPSTIVTEPRKN